MTEKRPTSTGTRKWIMSEMEEYLNKLEEAGLLIEGVRCGVIPTTVKNSLDIKRTYTKFVNYGFGIRKSVLLTSDECRVAASTVWRVLRRMP